MHEIGNTRELPITKLFVPRTRAELVLRPRLMDMLNNGLNCVLTLVSAPAGFGKTTLVVAWLRDLPRPYAWLSLDERDNDPVRFLRYITAALRQAEAAAGCVRGLSDIGPVLPPSAGGAASLLTYESNTSPAPLVLILDDYHVITNPDIHRLTESFLGQHPSVMHLVLLTREDPPLPLARLRAGAALLEVRARDLKFAPEEASEFFNRIMGLDLSPGEVTALEERTEGWAAGLQLAGVSLRGQPDRAGFVRAFAGTDRYVMDYLMDEVLRRQTPVMQDFLLRTSLLERFSGSLCDAVIHDDESADASREILEYLERANLFLIPLDNERCWYRYHQLFAELLRHRLHQTVDEADRDQLHRRAASWFARHDYAAEAIAHSLAAKDYYEAAVLIERELDTPAGTLANGEMVTMVDWLNQLPSKMILERPSSGLCASRVQFLAGRFTLAERILRQVEQRLVRGTAEPCEGASSGVIHTYLAACAAVHGDTGEAERLARQALSDLPAGDVLSRARAAHTLGMAYDYAGDTRRAFEAYQQASLDAEAAANQYLAITAGCDAALMEIAQGYLSRAYRTGERVLALAGTRTPATGLALILIGDILRERDRLHEAERHILDGLDLVRRGGLWFGLWSGLFGLSRVRLSKGDYDGALAAAEEAEAVIYGQDLPRFAGRIGAQRARIWVARGALDLARSWAIEYEPMEVRGCLPEFEDLTLVRIRLAVGEHEPALALLEAVLETAEAAGRMGSVIEGTILRALALDRAGANAPALVALGRAFDLAAPEDYRRIFLDEGPSMIRLARRAARQRIARARIEEILMPLDQKGTTMARGSTRNSSPQGGLVEPLSARELEVLGLMAAGLDNREIAQRLFLSLPTVKSHILRIYGKLCVNNRNQAVARAKALDILPS